MKILQKRTSRFVASLFNGLGIIACVSVSSCGSKGKNSKGKETDEFDGLKKKLKKANDNFGQLDSVPQHKIAQWFKDNPSQTNFSLTKDILQQIFVNDVNTLKSVAQTLGVDISDTDNEEKTKNVTVEIEKEGKASIVYSDNHSESFDFKDIDALKNFVNALADKNVVGVKGEKWSLVLENDKAIVCEHKDGFDYKNNFDEFLSCLNSLVKIQKLGFSGFKMTVDINGVSLDGYKLNDGDCQKIDFWQNVNKYAALFGLDNSKLYIEQKDEKVKINGFVTELMWSVVAEDEKNVNATWKSVFVIKGKEEEEKRKEEEERSRRSKEEETERRRRKEERRRSKEEETERRRGKGKDYNFL